MGAINIKMMIYQMRLKVNPGYLYKITESTIMDFALFFGPYGIPFTIINQVVKKEAISIIL